MFLSEINYHPLVFNINWTISLNAVSVNGRLCNSGLRKTLIDTGANFITMTLTDLIQIRNSIPGVEIVTTPGYAAHSLYAPCNMQPVFILIFGEVSHTVDPRD